METPNVEIEQQDPSKRVEMSAEKIKAMMEGNGSKEIEPAPLSMSDVPTESEFKEGLPIKPELKSEPAIEIKPLEKTPTIEQTIEPKVNLEPQAGEKLNKLLDEMKEVRDKKITLSIEIAKLEKKQAEIEAELSTIFPN